MMFENFKFKTANTASTNTVFWCDNVQQNENLEAWKFTARLSLPEVAQSKPIEAAKTKQS